MTKIATTLLVALLLALAAAPAEAATTYSVRVGIGDQNTAMFSHPGFQALKIKRVRYFIPWNAMRVEHERTRARTYVLAARRAGVSVLLHISSDDLRRKKAKLPSLTRYRRDVTRLVKYFRKLGVREWGARNEANHDSQPTYRSPKRAADEFKIVRRACGSRCTIVALDVLDQKGVERYMQRFYKALGAYRRHAKIVGIHNYSSVNRKRSKPTGSIIRTAKRFNRRTAFWLTETGAIARFSRSFPCSESRQASRLKYMFALTRRYRRDIDRLYSYNWTGAGCDARFDAGLTRADGSLRPAYAVFRNELKRFRR